MSIQVSSLGWLAWKEVSRREEEELEEGDCCCCEWVGLEEELVGLEDGEGDEGVLREPMKGSELERLCLVLRCLVKSEAFFFKAYVSMSRNTHPSEYMSDFCVDGAGIVLALRIVGDRGGGVVGLGGGCQEDEKEENTPSSRLPKFCVSLGSGGGARDG
jgi:hypothetical protein